MSKDSRIKVLLTLLLIQAALSHSLADVIPNVNDKLSVISVTSNSISLVSDLRNAPEKSNRVAFNVLIPKGITTLVSSPSLNISEAKQTGSFEIIASITGLQSNSISLNLSFSSSDVVGLKIIASANYFEDNFQVNLNTTPSLTINNKVTSSEFSWDPLFGKKFGKVSYKFLFFRSEIQDDVYSLTLGLINNSLNYVLLHDFNGKTNIDRGFFTEPSGYYNYVVLLAKDEVTGRVLKYNALEDYVNCSTQNLDDSIKVSSQLGNYGDISLCFYLNVNKDYYLSFTKNFVGFDNKSNGFNQSFDIDVRVLSKKLYKKFTLSKDDLLIKLNKWSDEKDASPALVSVNILADRSNFSYEDDVDVTLSEGDSQSLSFDKWAETRVLVKRDYNNIFTLKTFKTHEETFCLLPEIGIKRLTVYVNKDKGQSVFHEEKDIPEKKPYSLKLNDDEEYKFVFEVDTSKINDPNKIYVIRSNINDYSESHSDYGSTVSHFIYDSTVKLEYYFDLDDTYGDYLQNGFLSLTPNHDLSRSQAFLVKDFNKKEETKILIPLDKTERGFLIVNPFEYVGIEVTTYLKSDTNNYFLEADLTQFSWISDSSSKEEITGDKYEPSIYKHDLQSFSLPNVIIFFPDPINVRCSVSVDFPLLHSDDIFKESEILFDTSVYTVRTIEISKYSVADNGSVYISLLADQDTTGVVYQSNDFYESSYIYEAKPINYNLKNKQVKYIIYYPDLKSTDASTDYYIGLSQYSGKVSVTYGFQDDFLLLPESVQPNLISSDKFTRFTADSNKYVIVRVESASKDSLGDISVYKVSKSLGDVFDQVDLTIAVDITNSSKLITKSHSETRSYTITSVSGEGKLVLKDKTLDLNLFKSVNFDLQANIESVIEIYNFNSALSLIITSSSLQDTSVWYPNQSNKFEVLKDQSNIIIVEFQPDEESKRDIVFRSDALLEFTYFFHESQDPLNKVYYPRLQNRLDRNTLYSFSEIRIPNTAGRLVIYVNTKSVKNLSTATLTLKSYLITKLSLKSQQVPRDDDLFYFRIPPSDNQDNNFITFTFIKSINSNNDQLCRFEINNQVFFAFGGDDSIIKVIDASSFRDSGIVGEGICFIHSDQPQTVSPLYLNVAYVPQNYKNVSLVDQKKFKLDIIKSNTDQGVRITITPPTFFNQAEDINLSYKLLFAHDTYNYNKFRNNILFDSYYIAKEFDVEIYDKLPIEKFYSEEDKQYRVAVVAFDPISSLESATELATFNTVGVDRVSLKANDDKVIEINRSVDIEIPKPEISDLTLAFNIMTSDDSNKYTISSSSLNISLVSKVGPSTLILDPSKADFRKKVYISIQSNNKIKVIVSAYYFKRDPSVDYTSVPKDSKLKIKRMTNLAFTIQWAPLRVDKINYIWFATNKYSRYSSLGSVLIDYVEKQVEPFNIFVKTNEAKIDRYTFASGDFYRFATFAKDTETGRYFIYNPLYDVEVCNYIDLNTPYLYSGKKGTKLFRSACFKSTSNTVLINITDKNIDKEVKLPVSSSSKITYQSIKRDVKNVDIKTFIPVVFSTSEVFIFDFNLQILNDSSDVTITIINASDSTQPIKLGNQEFTYYVNTSYNNLINISPQKYFNSISAQSFDLVSPFVNISDIKLFNINKDGTRTLRASILQTKPLKAGTPFSYEYASKDVENISFQVEVDTKTLFDNDNLYIRTFRNQKIWLINEDVTAKAFYYDNNKFFYGLVDLSDTYYEDSEHIYPNGAINFYGDFSQINLTYSNKEEVNQIDISDFNFNSTDPTIINQGTRFTYHDEQDRRFILIKAKKADKSTDPYIMFQFDWEDQNLKDEKEFAFLQ